MKLSYISLLLQEVIFRISKIKLSGSNVKKFMTFSYISGDKNRGKDSYILLKRSFSYISGNGNPEKIPNISRNGIFLYVRKRKL